MSNRITYTSLPPPYFFLVHPKLLVQEEHVPTIKVTEQKKTKQVLYSIWKFFLRHSFRVCEGKWLTYILFARAGKFR